MNIQQILGRFASGTRTASPVGLVGAGQFGATFVAQAARMEGLRVVAIADRDMSRARSAAVAAGHRPDRIRLCSDAGEAAVAVESGCIAIVDSAATLVALPLVAVLEATGDPDAAAATAVAAIDAKRHVVLATKEAEIVVGSELARRAAARGVVFSPVDGDQPSLLIGLVGWARMMGFPIVCAGKSSESDFVWDPIARTVSAWGRTVDAPGFDRWFSDSRRPETCGVGHDTLATLAARAALPFAATTVPDLCEMGIVANHTALMPDRPTLHAPIARTVELPALMRPRASGGLLGGAGRIDMFNCLRRPDELSFAGGVFVVIEAPDIATGKLFASKGIPTSADGRYVLLHDPVHLLGAEAAVSVLSAVDLGCSSGGVEVEHRVDLVATAARDLEPGERLQIGERHAIPGLEHALLPSNHLGEGAAVPYYLLAGASVRRTIRRGEPLTGDSVDLPEGGTLLALRRAQDARTKRRAAPAP